MALKCHAKMEEVVSVGNSPVLGLDADASCA